MFFLCEKTILKMENNKKNFNFLVKKILNQKKKLFILCFFMGKNNIKKWKITPKKKLPSMD